MHLTRCQDQKSLSLEEFYQEISQQESVVCGEGGRAMLVIISALDKRIKLLRQL